jgi:hypothetical protein
VDGPGVMLAEGGVEVLDQLNREPLGKLLLCDGHAVHQALPSRDNAVVVTCGETGAVKPVTHRELDIEGEQESRLATGMPANR